MLDPVVSGDGRIIVRMLGMFSVTADGLVAGPWPRPSAKRLCALVLLSPGRVISKDLACEELFPALPPYAAARSLSKALSMARAALAPLGDRGASLLSADRTSVWGAPDARIDLEDHVKALRDALRMAPGPGRGSAIARALAYDSELLADEPYADWALRARDRLEMLRQDARIALARDGADGSEPASLAMALAAWQAAFDHDSACEEAAIALMCHYAEAGRREVAIRVYRRCVLALTELGLRASEPLNQACAAVRLQPSIL